MSRDAPRRTEPRHELQTRERDLLRELEEVGGIRSTNADWSAAAEDGAGQSATDGERPGARKQGDDPPLRVGEER